MELIHEASRELLQYQRELAAEAIERGADLDVANRIVEDGWVMAGWTDAAITRHRAMKAGGTAWLEYEVLEELAA